ncbi:MAG: VWA domain-containing protein [Bdellovibrionales bacterium]|nr:VWA domain-containing protein [Bdellovibrionales bacterium]
MADDDDSTSESPSQRNEGQQQDPNGQDRKDEWDLAIRFRDIQRFGYLHAKEKKEMSDRAIEAVLDRGREALGPIQKPYHYEMMSQEELGADYHEAELDVESTLEDPTRTPQFRIRREKDHGLVLVLDTSLSMKGEKLALLAVSVAAVAMSLPLRSFAIFGFDSEIHTVKDFNQEIDAAECVRRVLSIPPGGFTNLELGLKTAIQKIQTGHFPQARVILISDGRYTEGKHPAEIGKTIPFLYSVKIGKDPTGRDIMKDLAMSGLGSFTEVREMPQLPKVLLSGIRTWVR